MRKTASLLTAVPVIVSLVCASAVTAHAAPAAPRAHAAAAAVQAAAPLPVGWRIVASFPAGTSVDKLAASGPDSAWAVESCRKPCKSGNGVILRHWNGKSWQAQPQPAVAKHTGDAEPGLAIAPGSKDVWAVYDLYDGKVHGSAAEWTGKSWGKATLFPADVTFTAVVAAGPSDVWAFGLASDGSPAAVRGPLQRQDLVEGRAARPRPGPLDRQLPGRRSDIWAQAIAAKGFSLAVSRWNGIRWVKQPAPAAPKGADGVTGGPIVVSGRSGVWGYGYFALGSSSHTDWLVHFDGTSWSRVRNPYPLSRPSSSPDPSAPTATAAPGSRRFPRTAPPSTSTTSAPPGTG